MLFNSLYQIKLFRSLKQSGLDIKNLKLLYYIKNYGYTMLPAFFFKKKYSYLKKVEGTFNQKELYDRLEYYFQIKHPFSIPEKAIPINKIQKTISSYYFDLKEFLYYFHSSAKFAYHFGDETHINSFPTLFKARPIGKNSATSILFKLDKHRHFKWVQDPYTFSQKKNLMVWRGGIYKEPRTSLIPKIWNKALCDVGQTSGPVKNSSYQKGFMSIAEQLKHKFIFCPEGNDVATNLKWVMSSNSLCVMPKPKHETWFMEGTLKPNIHYIEIKDDCSDLEEKILYYSKHQAEAHRIIKNAHKHVTRFKNRALEDLLCLKVLERYFLLSKQQDVIKFR